MPDPSDNLPAQNELHTARFDHRPARVSGLAALAVIFAGAGYSHELGFMVYAVLFVIPHAVFVGARSSRKWQAWGLAIGWVTSTAVLLLAAFTAFKMMRNTQGSQIAILGFLLALLLSQVVQIIFVRRAFSGKIAFGTPLFRVALYYGCVLLVVAATLPNWYVPPAVRENKSVKSPHEDSSTLKLPAARSTNQDKTYPPKLYILSAKVNTNRREGDDRKEQE
ncbi:MAG TPA: hypothetical protein VGK22_18105 [Candidatus Angelobacter sp.]|jgi:hypothetical protein